MANVKNDVYDHSLYTVLCHTLVLRNVFVMELIM